MASPRIKQVRTYLVRSEGGGDYFSQKQGHWLIDTLIANPMSGYADYKASRTSWGVNVMGSIVVEIESESGHVGLATGFGGVVGDSISGFMASLMSAPGLPIPRVIAGLLCAVGGLLAVGWSFQVKPEDVRTAAGHVKRTAVGSADAAQRAIGYVAEKTRRPEPEEERVYRAPIEDRSLPVGDPGLHSALEPARSSRLIYLLLGGIGLFVLGMAAVMVLAR